MSGKLEAIPEAHWPLPGLRGPLPILSVVTSLQQLFISQKWKVWKLLIKKFPKCCSEGRLAFLRLEVGVALQHHTMRFDKLGKKT